MGFSSNPLCSTLVWLHNFESTFWLPLQEGMGLLQVHSDGVKLEEGESEFLFPVYTQEIHSREVSWLPASAHSAVVCLVTEYDALQLIVMDSISIYRLIWFPVDMWAVVLKE